MKIKKETIEKIAVWKRASILMSMNPDLTKEEILNQAVLELKAEDKISQDFEL